MKFFSYKQQRRQVNYDQCILANQLTEFYNIGLALFYLSIVLKSMNTRQQGGQKFFRRTSKSPWEQCRAGHSSDLPVSTYQPVNYAHVSLINKNSSVADMDNQYPVSITNITDQNSENINHSWQGIELRKHNGNEKVIRNASIVNSLPKHPEDIKFTYIPIQSMSTTNTLPTTSKKISQVFEDSKTISKQEYQAMKKEIETLKDQNKSLLEIEGQKNAQNVRLLKQVQVLKKNNCSLESDAKKLRQTIYNAQKNLKISQINTQNLKRNLEVTEYLKTRFEDNLKQANQNLRKIEAQLRTMRESNNELLKINFLKEREINEIRGEFDKQLKKVKSATEALTEPKALRNRANTLQQNINPDQSISNIRVVKEAQGKMPIPKCTRYTQTENNNLERALKELECFTLLCHQKEGTIEKMGGQIDELTFKMREFDDNLLKVQGLQQLVQDLNEKIVMETALMLSNKYRYC